MNEPTPKPPRRRTWFTFSIRGLFVAVTLSACLIGLVAAVRVERRRCEEQIQAHHQLIDPRNLSAGTQMKFDESIRVRSGLWEKIWGFNYFDRVTEIEIRHSRATTDPYGKTSAVEMEALRHFPNLKTLIMDSRAVRSPGFSCLAHLHSLERLILDRSYITEAELASISDLKKLTYLDLRYTRIGDQGVAHLMNLDQLKTLLLARSKITNNSIPTLAKLKSLEELNLSFTEISPDAIPELAKLASLKKLTLATSQFPPATQATLQKSLPNCELEFKD